MSCEICEVLKEDNLVIYETNLWRVSLSPLQTYLGRSYITLKRHCPDLAELTTDEWNEFIEIVKGYEEALRKSFSPSVFNWFCQMNNAFRNDPPDPHVHWHLRPRYGEKKEFVGQTFEDLEFGGPHSGEREKSSPPEILQQITDHIKSNLL